ncbi:MAG: hypothetical protein ACKV2T_38020 [Kofleriaceae bacterium]
MTVLAWVFFAVGAFVVLGNWLSFAHAVVTKKGTSFVPFIGGIPVLVGCALHPAIDWKLGLIALAVDPGCWVVFAFPVVWFVRRVRAPKEQA